MITVSVRSFLEGDKDDFKTPFELKLLVTVLNKFSRDINSVSLNDSYLCLQDDAKLEILLISEDSTSIASASE